MTRLAHILTRMLRVVAKNRLGFGLGIAYSLFSFATFFIGLGYGASCPELGPDVCDNPPLHVAIAASPVSFYVAIIHAASWGILFYSSQQIMILVNPGLLTSSSLDFTNLMIVVGILITAIWAFFGALVQRSIRNMRTGAKAPHSHA